MINRWCCPRNMSVVNKIWLERLTAKLGVMDRSKQQNLLSNIFPLTNSLHQYRLLLPTFLIVYLKIFQCTDLSLINEKLSFPQFLLLPIELNFECILNTHNLVNCL